MLHSTDAAPMIRQMKAGEVELAAEWAGVEGWNPGLNDARCFYAADPNGFFLAEVDGNPVGCISAVRYGEGFGFLGLYIVLPEHRGKGYGMALWNSAMEYLSGRNVGLDGVVAQQANYKKSGFVLAHRNIRYEMSADERNTAVENLRNLSGQGSQTAPVQFVSASEVPFAELQQYDTGCFCADRAEFLKCWLDQQGVASQVALV